MAKVSMITFATCALIVRLAFCLAVPIAQGAVEEILRDGSMSVKMANDASSIPLIASSFGTRTALTPFEEFLAKRQVPSSSAPPATTPPVASAPPASTAPPAPSAPPASTAPPASAPPAVPSTPPASTPGVAPTTSTTSSTSTKPSPGAEGSPSSTATANNSGNGLSTGATAGAAVGGAAGGVLIIALLVWWKWSSIKRLAQSSKASSATEAIPVEESKAEKDFSVGRYDSYADVSSSSGVLSSSATSTTKTSRRF